MDQVRTAPMENQPLEDPHNAARPECLAAAQLLLRALASHPALERGGLRELAEQMQDCWRELAHTPTETRSHEVLPKADNRLQALLAIHRVRPH